MIRLLVGDVWEHWHVWFGALAVATAFGYMGGWFASFSATAAADPMVSTSFFFRSAAQAILMFSAISGCVVLSSVARGCVVSLRRTYALWQVINIPPVVVALPSSFKLHSWGSSVRAWAWPCAGQAHPPCSALCSWISTCSKGSGFCRDFPSVLRFLECRYYCRCWAGRAPQGRGVYAARDGFA